MHKEKKVLSGWGNFPITESNVLVPLNETEIRESLNYEKLIPRGLGRSYADQAVNTGHAVLDITKLNRIVSFDEEEGLLECEAGVDLEMIINRFTPSGWFPMITPGTKFVTIAGSIANDVHGKAHHIDGTFVNSVLDFKIMLANGEVVTASRDTNSDLFYANFGGLGLLGIILSARIKLRKIDTTYFIQKSIPVKNLDHLLDEIERVDKEYQYSVAWVDSLAKGDRLGRGVLIAGNAANISQLPKKLKGNPLRIADSAKLKIPFFLPSFTLNNFTVNMLNKLLYVKQKNAPKISHYESFFYPLDMIHDWNKGYGRKGFIQYQFVVPLEKGRENVKKILTAISHSGCVPFLNVLKKFGRGMGGLSFADEGYTLAIDFPVSQGLKEFTKILDRMVLEAGGKIYLGKDAFLDKNMFRKMFPEHAEWIKVKAKYDPGNKFSSNLSRRVGLEA